MIGGAEIFRLFLPLADRIELTEVHARPEGDTFLPPFDPAHWREASREAHPAGTAGPPSASSAWSGVRTACVNLTWLILRPAFELVRNGVSKRTHLSSSDPSIRAFARVSLTLRISGGGLISMFVALTACVLSHACALAPRLWRKRSRSAEPCGRVRSTIALRRGQLEALIAFWTRRIDHRLELLDRIQQGRVSIRLDIGRRVDRNPAGCEARPDRRRKDDARIAGSHGPNWPHLDLHAISAVRRIRARRCDRQRG